LKKEGILQENKHFGLTCRSVIDSKVYQVIFLFCFYVWIYIGCIFHLFLIYLWFFILFIGKN